MRLFSGLNNSATLKICFFWESRAIWLLKATEPFIQFSCSVMSDSLWPHGLQHARLPCPSQTSGACSNSCLELVMTSNYLVLCHPLSSCLQSFPEWWSFLRSDNWYQLLPWTFLLQSPVDLLRGEMHVSLFFLPLTKPYSFQVDTGALEAQLEVGGQLGQ